MIHIIGSAALDRALTTPSDPTLQRLLAVRREQLADYDDDSLLNFLVVEPGDALPAIEHALGLSPLGTDSECVLDHGDWLEAVYVLSDDGAGVILLARDDDGLDSALLSHLRAHAAPAQDGGADVP